MAANKDFNRLKVVLVEKGGAAFFSKTVKR